MAVFVFVLLSVARLVPADPPAPPGKVILRFADEQPILQKSSAKAVVREAPNGAFATVSWEDMHKCAVLKGLSPLYEAVGAECQRVLTETRRWAALPTPIDVVHSSPEESPIFEMHSGDTYFNVLNDAAIRWTAEQTWQGRFRLFYNTTFFARAGDDYLLIIDGPKQAPRRISGTQWTDYSWSALPFWLPRKTTRHFCAYADRAWCVGYRKGVFTLSDKAWEPIAIPDFPSGGAEGVISDNKGRVAVWSTERGAAGRAVAIKNDDKWITKEWPQRSNAGPWSKAAIRPNGTIVVAADSQFAIIDPKGDPAPKFGVQRQQELEHLQNGELQLGDGRWVRVISGDPALNRRGVGLFVAQDMTPGSDEIDAEGRRHLRLGLVRASLDAPPTWIDVKDSRWLDAGTQIVPCVDDSFLLLVRFQGAFLLKPDSSELLRVADADEFVDDDRVVGVDREERAYIRRGHAFLVFDYRAKREALVEPEIIGKVQIDHRGHPTMPGKASEKKWRTAVDSQGRAWFVPEKGDGLMVQHEPHKPTREFDDRVGRVASIWPGRDGSMLILGQHNATFVSADGSIHQNESLVDLAHANFAAMAAAAPLASRDERRVLPGYPDDLKIAPPWLSTGKCLWVADEELVCRLHPSNRADNSLEADKICQGAFDLRGPLHSGHLLLIKRDPESLYPTRKLSQGFWIKDPEGSSELQPIAAPPNKQGDSYLERPDSIEGAWMLDSDGTLWLAQGADRVYRVESAGKWPLLDFVGVPTFEYPKGVVWARHSFRVFAGYEAVGPETRRSCIPSYLDGLIPLFEHEGQVYCRSPLGFAVLDAVDAKHDKDSALREIHVHWTELPTTYVGHFKDRAYVITGRGSGAALVSVALSE
jgi:hypothetical protein